MNVRPPAVADLFYPGDTRILSHDVRTMLAGAHSQPLRPKAIIAPHAGYIYSGPIAAAAYALLLPFADEIKRVVLLGPAHRFAVRGLALPGAEAFDTPLGRIELDLDAVNLIAELPQIRVSPEAHMQEHSLEVHLPFLQTVLHDFKLLPLVVGFTDAADVAEVLERLWGGPETLIVVSSDLSHYHPYVIAQEIDRVTVDAILHGQAVSHDQACGGTPVNGLTLAARHHGLTPHLLDLRNSGDTAGDQASVVGYAAMAYTEAA